MAMLEPTLNLADPQRPELRLYFEPADDFVLIEATDGRQSWGGFAVPKTDLADLVKGKQFTVQLGMFFLLTVPSLKSGANQRFIVIGKEEVVFHGEFLRIELERVCRELGVNG